MASPQHSNTMVTTRCFDGRNCNTGSNATPAGKDDIQDGTCQQQQFATDAGYSTSSHPASRSFHCTACHRQFASQKYLSMHMALHKMADEPPPPGSDVRTVKRQSRSGSVAHQWSCPTCGKIFAQNSNFRNHVRTHSEQRPYVCLVCLVGFKERYHLKKHTLFKHSPGQLNEACRLCGKRFKDLTAVRAHERTHSDVRPYACSRCDKMFKTSECLWHHENRSKTCSGRSQRSYCYELNSSGSRQSTSKRHQRRNCASLPSTTSSNPRRSTTKAAAAVATSLTHFSLSPSAEASTSPPPNTVCCAVAPGVKQETEIAEPFDRDINTLWKTVASDSVTVPTICNDNIGVNFCTSANCSNNVITETGARSGCSQQFWDSAMPTDLSSQNNHRRMRSSIDVVSSDAAFQFGYSERRPLDQTTSYCMQQSGSNDVFDEQAIIHSCSMMIHAYESGRSLNQSLAKSQALIELAGSSGTFCGSNQVMSAADVSSIKNSRHRGNTSSICHAVLPLPVKTFHLPPIETFAPRHDVSTDRPQQWSTVARY